MVQATKDIRKDLDATVVAEGEITYEDGQGLAQVVRNRADTRYSRGTRVGNRFDFGDDGPALRELEKS